MSDIASRPLKGMRFAELLVSITLVVAILHLARVVLIPIALAVFVAFVLSPLVRRLDLLGIGRIPAVLVVVCTAGLLLAAVSWLVISQIRSLAYDLPRHRDNIREKVGALTAGTRGGIVEKVQSTIEDATRPSEEEQAAAEKKDAASTEKVPDPLLVRIAPDDGPEKALAAAAASILALGPLFEVMATCGLALVLVIFMLISREDLRNRLVSFALKGSLNTTTKALDDAGRRISRYLIMQLIINGSFGVAVAIGLMVIGVPYAMLWGLCAAVFRYIPYIGPWVAALLPIAVSVITSPGWTQLVMILGLFLVLELLSNNIMEPWLYGQGVGVSVVALLVSAAFWTWIWGPLGLILATPLTVCLVVLGKYVPALSFLDRLLGDQPALEPHAAYLQRLLAQDALEASKIVQEYRAEHSPETVYDKVIVPALAMARKERSRGTMDPEVEAFVLSATSSILDQLMVEPGAPSADNKLASESLPIPIKIIGCAAHEEAEELTLRMLDQVLAPQGFGVEVLSTRMLPSDIVKRVEQERIEVVVIAVLPPGGLIQASYLCKLLKKRLPHVGIVVGCWGYKRNLDRTIVKLRSAGAQYVTTTLLGAREQVNALARTKQLPQPASDRESHLTPQ